MTSARLLCIGRKSSNGQSETLVLSKGKSGNLSSRGHRSTYFFKKCGPPNDDPGSEGSMTVGFTARGSMGSHGPPNDDPGSKGSTTACFTSRGSMGSRGPPNDDPDSEGSTTTGFTARGSMATSWTGVTEGDLTTRSS